VLYINTRPEDHQQPSGVSSVVPLVATGDLAMWTDHAGSRSFAASTFGGPWLLFWEQ
jgi:hypothetical protein